MYAYSKQKFYGIKARKIERQSAVEYLPVLISPHTLHNGPGTPIADSFIVVCCIL